jgi:hypothetical protein
MHAKLWCDLLGDLVFIIASSRDKNQDFSRFRVALKPEFNREKRNAGFFLQKMGVIFMD